MKKPNDIPGLLIWLDAADSSTVLSTSSTPLDGQKVKKMIDKKSGVTFSNTTFNGGPSYSYASVNGKNALQMQSSYDSFGDGREKSLYADVNILGSATTSIFCVFKPSSPYPNTTSRYFVFGLNDAYLTSIPITTPSGAGNGYFGQFPNKAISLEGSSPSKNQSIGYIEGKPEINATFLAGTPRTYATFYEHVPSRNLLTSTSSVDKVCLVTARVQNNLKKISFIFENNDWVDDFSGIRTVPNNLYNLTGPVYGLTYSDNPVNNPDGTQSISIGCYSGSFHFSNSGSGLAPFRGFFCEFLYYNRFLSDYETNSIKAYLREKWFEPDIEVAVGDLPVNDPTKAPIIGAISGPFGLFVDDTGVYGYFVAGGIQRNPIVKGFVWSDTDPDPTLQTGTSQEINQEGNNNDFAGYIPGSKTFLPDTLYYVRAYGTNQWGTGYSPVRAIFTKTVDLLGWAFKSKGSWGYTASVSAAEVGLPGIVTKGSVLNSGPIQIYLQNTVVEDPLTIPYSLDSTGMNNSSDLAYEGTWFDTFGVQDTFYTYIRAWVELPDIHDFGNGPVTLGHKVYSNEKNRL